jgi:hypothetical protein
MINYHEKYYIILYFYRIKILIYYKKRGKLSKLVVQYIFYSNNVSKASDFGR